MIRVSAVVIAVVTGLGLVRHASAQSTPSLAELEHRIGIVNDMDEIERFHHIYGFQQDYMIYYSQADLASDEPGEYRWKYGVFVGGVCGLAIGRGSPVTRICRSSVP
jgi:hypothetical protein